MNHGTPVTDARENGSKDVDDAKPFLRIWEAIDEIHRDQKAVLRKLGEITTANEKDREERRAAAWAKFPVWLGVLAWVAIAAVEIYARLR